ncbi:hypothetical protein [Agromyces seonyuensis]|uniref:DUF1440 domain-containing protein n=1 Tax=Agromyces seonyuensis TaxID=2662446 RepID=A0A6I4NUD4_9MICO|nr:hypothetical protein [Agromyces seonyuensis]MWB97843.1 hypothetical protein [Agromyces seonyuensis]
MKLVTTAAAGVLAGAVGTLAMDLVWYRRYRRSGGTERFLAWEFAEDTTSWETASAPGQVGLRAFRVALRRTPPDTWARPTTNLVHWATGAGWGVAYALARRSVVRSEAAAAALGPAAWLTSYATLPLLGVYRPIWKYDARTLARDLGAHTIFGLATATTLAAVDR